MTTTLWDRSAGADAGGAGGAGAGSPEVPSPNRSLRGRLRGLSRRRWGIWVVIGAVVVGLAVVMVWRGPAPTNNAALDPDNPAANGAQAVARVLAGRGVTVTVARGQAELSRARIDADTTVLVARTSELAEATTTALADSTAGAERLVVVDPEPWVLRYLSPGAELHAQRRSAADLVAAECGTGDIRPGESLSHSQSEFRANVDTAACFTHDSRSVYLALPGGTDRAPIVLLGSSSALTNQEVGEASNAAIVLRTLGHSAHLVWYVPSRSDIPTTDRSRTGQLVPPWLAPSLLLGLFAVLALLLWRGRRLGRLVREPLPVVIRAVETTESRGRLYRHARDATRAALVLQDATRTRLAGYLGLPARGPADPLVRAVAAATGRPVLEVGSLLAGPPPSTDAQLLGLAAELAALEEEVRRT